MTTKGDLPKHIFLFILDAARKDHLSLYGYPRRTSPNLEKLARKADIYPWAFSPSSYTLASVPSILAAKYPLELSNHFAVKEFTEGDFEILRGVKALGYKTAFFTGNPVTSSKVLNLKEFFDFFWDELTVKELNRDEFYQEPGVTLKAVKEFIARNKKEKVFVAIHLMGAHGPYVPDVEPIFRNDALFKTDKRKVTRVVSDTFAGVTSDLLKKEKVIPRYQLLGLVEGQGGEIEDFERNVNEYVARYDTGIYLLDKNLGDFFGFLEDQRIYDPFCLIITSDHGEFLGEENIFFSHGILTHPALVNVPLIIKNPSQKKRRPINTFFSTKDILPEVLQLNPPSFEEPIYSFTAKSLSIIKEPMLFLIHNGDFHHGETFKECIYTHKNFDLEQTLENFAELNVDIYFRVFKKEKLGFRPVSLPQSVDCGSLVSALLETSRVNFRVLENLFNAKLEEELRKQSEDHKMTLDSIHKQLEDHKVAEESLRKQMKDYKMTLDSIHRSRAWKLVTFLRKVKYSIPIVKNL